MEIIVILSILYNLVGQEVATLLDGQMNAGYHSARFDASHLPSGIYFSRLVAGETVETQRVILLK
ncbi:MAG: T9SS type A sorting domain-containing protein [Ignavibacteriales bacterium]|nr:T9SS type A sorting domain-containing protein [Ignavibacteriales bacterium]